MTYYLAKQTGCFSDDGAKAIAEGNQGTDEEDSTLPGKGRIFENSKYHALHDGAQQGVGSSALLQNVSDPNPKYFGQYLHYLQDTFSHSGYTNSSYGHLFGTHSVDKTATDVNKAIRMAESTYAALDGYSQLKCGCPADPWNQSMEEQIRRFAEVGSLYPRLTDIEGDTGLPYLGKRQGLSSQGSLGRKISILGLNWR